MKCFGCRKDLADGGVFCDECFSEKTSRANEIQHNKKEVSLEEELAIYAERYRVAVEKWIETKNRNDLKRIASIMLSINMLNARIYNIP